MGAYGTFAVLAGPNMSGMCRLLEARPPWERKTRLHCW